MEHIEVGNTVCFYRRGISYSGIAVEDMGIKRGTGRQFRVTSRHDGPYIDQVKFNEVVSQRHLLKEDVTWTTP